MPTPRAQAPGVGPTTPPPARRRYAPALPPLAAGLGYSCPVCDARPEHECEGTTNRHPMHTVRRRLAHQPSTQHTGADRRFTELLRAQPDVPCRAEHSADWTSDDQVTRERASELCLDCPLMLACDEAAMELGARGVWGGRDRGF